MYLKRLFLLHMGLTEALKRILLDPPKGHAPKRSCDNEGQGKLTRAWALACAYLAWDAKPSMSSGVIEAALLPLADHLDCRLCEKLLRDRVKDLVEKWNVVKVRDMSM